VLHQLNAAIHRLSDAEATRVEAEKALWLQRNSKARLGALGRWAGGGGFAKKTPEEDDEDQRREGVKTVRENVVWFLRERLRRVGELQAGMVEMRLEREVERSKSVLYKAQGGAQPQMGMGNGDMGGFAPPNGGFQGAKGWEMDEMAKERGEEGMQLDEEQLQLFAKENQDMLKHYENTLDQVRYGLHACLPLSLLWMLISVTEKRSLHYWRSRNYRAHWPKTSPRNLRRSSSWFKIRTRRRRMWAGVTRSSSVRARGRVRPGWYSCQHASSVRA